MKKLVVASVLCAGVVAGLIALNCKKTSAGEIQSKSLEPQNLKQYTTGWTNCRAKVYQEPSESSKIYCTYKFNSCVRHTEFSDEFDEVVYYDFDKDVTTFVYIKKCEINDYECRDAKEVADPTDMIGTGTYLVDHIPQEWNGYTCDLFTNSGDFIGEYIVGEDQISFDGTVYAEVY